MVELKKPGGWEISGEASRTINLHFLQGGWIGNQVYTVMNKFVDLNIEMANPEGCSTSFFHYELDRILYMTYRTIQLCAKSINQNSVEGPLPSRALV